MTVTQKTPMVNQIAQSRDILTTMLLESDVRCDQEPASALPHLGYRGGAVQGRAPVATV